ncbi:MAG TPA: DUF5606 domain-containing protein [Nitrosopumilaceae archaeon]|nr:DUF5606 domain-containing protein [Nitrosopumilaceae archaeon]
MIDLSGIISITGMPGLYKVVAQSKNGVIVESLVDKKRFPAYTTSKISALEDISMFTESDDKLISEILDAVFDKEQGAKCIDNKADEKEIIAYFSAILPDYDKERVYVSNMRKLFSWYNMLQETGNLKKKEENAEKTEEKKIIPGEEKIKKTIKAHNKDTSRPSTKTPTLKAAGVRKTGTA